MGPSPSARRRALLAVPASPSARALSLARSRSSPIYEAWSHHVLMSLCPALAAAAAAETPPRDLSGEGPARGARGSKLCCAVPAAALAPGARRAGPGARRPLWHPHTLPPPGPDDPRPHPTLLPGALPTLPGPKGDACLTARDLGAVNHARCSLPGPRGRSRAGRSGPGTRDCGKASQVRVSARPSLPCRLQPLSYLARATSPPPSGRTVSPGHLPRWPERPLGSPQPPAVAVRARLRGRPAPPPQP